MFVVISGFWGRGERVRRRRRHSGRIFETESGLAKKKRVERKVISAQI